MHAPIQISDNTHKCLTRRPAGRTVVLALTYPADEAEALRRMACGITIKKDRHPSMSLLARYALGLFERELERDPEVVLRALERMVTPEPTKATKRKAAP